MMTYKSLLFAKDGGIATITLNRRERLNAWGGGMPQELPRAFQEADADPEVRVVILTGAGRAFCAGLDLKESAERRPQEPSRPQGEEEPTGSLAGILRNMSKPTIAAINGVAVGIGVTMCLACDLRVVAEDANLGLVFTRVGLVPEAGSTFSLPRLVGLGKALELVLTGATITGKEAERLGLAQYAVPAQEVLPKAREIATRILECAPISTKLARQGLYSALDSTLDAALKFEAAALSRCYASQDHREALQAFGEKRKPVFRGQ